MFFEKHHQRTNYEEGKSTPQTDSRDTQEAPTLSCLGHRCNEGIY